jgi:hypothetical protein
MIRERAWQVFVAYPDEASATVVAEYLRLNNCPAIVIPPFPGPDLAPSAAVLVPGQLIHRARWLWAQAQVSEAELIYLSMGALAVDSDDPPQRTDAA